MVEPDRVVQQPGHRENAVDVDPGGVECVEIAFFEVLRVSSRADADDADPVPVGTAGGNVRVVDLVPAAAGEVVFVSSHPVRVFGNPADRGVFQMYDHRPPGRKLVVELGQAIGQAAVVIGVSGGRPDRAV